MRKYERESGIPAQLRHESRIGTSRLDPTCRRASIDRLVEREVLERFAVPDYGRAAADCHAREHPQPANVYRTPPLVRGQIAATARVSGLFLVRSHLDNFQSFDGPRVESRSLADATNAASGRPATSSPNSDGSEGSTGWQALTGFELPTSIVLPIEGPSNAATGAHGAWVRVRQVDFRQRSVHSIGWNALRAHDCARACHFGDWSTGFGAAISWDLSRRTPLPYWLDLRSAAPAQLRLLFSAIARVRIRTPPVSLKVTKLGCRIEHRWSCNHLWNR